MNYVDTADSTVVSMSESRRVSACVVPASISYGSRRRLFEMVLDPGSPDWQSVE